MSFIQNNQGYAQWNQWGQAPQNDWQAQLPLDAWQPGCNRQEQVSWNTFQPCGSWQGQSPWNTPQPHNSWQDQDPWNALQPHSGWQDVHEIVDAWPGQQEGTAQWPDDPGGLFTDPFEVPSAVPSAPPEAARPGQAHRSKAVSIILNILTFCFVGFLLAGSTMFAFSNKDTKSLFGYRFYNVLTPSMKPLFKPGDMIFVKLTEPSEVKVGDVVTFSPSQKSDAFLTHRVVELLPAEDGKQACMITKGDYNNAADPPVGLSSVIGVHKFTIPFFGNVVDMMRANLLVVCVCMGAVFLLLTVLRAYFAAREEEKKKPAAAPPPASRFLDIHAF